MSVSRYSLVRGLLEATTGRMWLILFAVAAFLVSISFYNYLLFHVLAEFVAIGVAALMAVVAWHTYSYSRNHFLMFLACGYFWIAALDLVHTLVYKGMNIYPIEIANPATQFWIGTRFSEAMLLLVAPLFFTRRVNRGIAFIGFGIVSVILYTLIMTGNFPDAYIEGEGLTQFKVNSEYFIIALLAAALAHLIRNRVHIEPSIFSLLAFSIVLTMIAELSFTFYVSVYGLSNLVGHILKLFSFWLIFIAIVRTNLQKPYISLQEEVAERVLAEERIRYSLKEKEVLLREIHHRVKNNLQVISSMLSLQASAETHDRSIEVLEESRRRVGVIARIHENLHRSDDLASLNARDYISSLVDDIRSVYKAQAQNVSFRLNVDDIVFYIDHAVASGQIISELLSNTLKHAYANDQHGNVEVSLHRTKGNEIELTVSDDGKGLPNNFNLQQCDTVGMRLVQALAMQLGGRIKINSLEGVRIQITFPEKMV